MKAQGPCKVHLLHATAAGVRCTLLGAAVCISAHQLTASALFSDSCSCLGACSGILTYCKPAQHPPAANQQAADVTLITQARWLSTACWQAATRPSTKPRACSGTSTRQPTAGRTRWRPGWFERHGTPSWTPSRIVSAPTFEPGYALENPFVSGLPCTLSCRESACGHNVLTSTGSGQGLRSCQPAAER